MVALGVDSRLEFSPPVSVAEECLLAAEESAEQVLNLVQPTLDSVERRRDVIEYIQQLLKSRLHCEVVSYGSVPLKTYLPDGDIDLTVLKGPNPEETLISDVLAVIQEEERNENSEFEVRETQFIDAEKVKLVKCLCRNITIDISCNQLGGLSTLCFLEKVDQFIGRNHLFKRSIILVKSWCYYESRILGAHHGLISTYALEILVLYIFQFFHSSLIGPLSLLHRFLDYYSQFDWENYCISLNGPVCRSSLPDMLINISGKPSNSQLLSEEFLESCMGIFSCKGKGNSKPLQIKHLNIVDPLEENNNLGRSVNTGNYFRIRSAFKYGSHKLNQIISRSKDEVFNKVLGYFANTCGRNEHRHRSIMQSLALDIAVLSLEDGMLFKSYAFDQDNNSVFWKPASISSVTDELGSCATGEGITEMTSDSCSGAEGVSINECDMVGTISSLESSFSTLCCGTPEDDLSSSNYSLYPSEDQLCAENGNLDFPKGYSSFGNRNSCGSDDECSEDTLSSIYITRLLDSSDEEYEVLDALADLTGDYDNHIRSLLHGQLCNWLSATSNFSRSPLCLSSSSSGTQIVDMNPKAISSNHSTMKETAKERALHATFFGSVFRLQRNQKAQGIGTYFPKMNVIHTGRPSSEMIRNCNNALYHASHESPPPSKTHSRKSNLRGNKKLSMGSCRIEFGILRQNQKQSHSPPVKRSFEKRMAIHPFNETEFPPLPCTRNK